MFAATAAFAPSAERVAAFPFSRASDEGFATFLNDVKSSKASCVVSGDAMSARVTRRAETLERAADLIEGDTTAMAKLIMREAGKTLVDAVDEVRECVDFFRFYARRARETLTTPTTLRTVTGESWGGPAPPRGAGGWGGAASRARSARSRVGRGCASGRSTSRSPSSGVSPAARSSRGTPW
jgi:hypothetical protein